MKAFTEPYTIEWIDAHAQGLYDPEYMTGVSKPRYPVPAKLFCPCRSCTLRVMLPYDKR